MFSGDRDVARGRMGPFHSTLEGISRFWDRIDVLTPRAEGASPKRLFGNVHIHPSSQARIAQPRSIVRETGSLLSERPYALAVSHDFGLFYNGVGALRVKARYGIPYVSELHHVAGHPRAANAGERVLKWIARWYVQWSKAEVLAFRAVNDVQMPALLRSWGVPQEKILVLPSGNLDLETFRPRESKTVRWDAMFCGRLAPNKGLDLLAGALAAIAGARPESKFLIVGEGPKRKSLERRLRSLGVAGAVTFAGWIDSEGSLAEEYRSSRVLLCTSYNEGGPRVCLEAMACATPVVATPVGLMPELIEDRLNGRIANWDAREIAAAALEIIGDPEAAERMGRLGRQTVEPLAKEKTLPRYARAYRELAERAAGAPVR